MLTLSSYPHTQPEVDAFWKSRIFTIRHIFISKLAIKVLFLFFDRLNRNYSFEKKLLTWQNTRRNRNASASEPVWRCLLIPEKGRSSVHYIETVLTVNYLSVRDGFGNQIDFIAHNHNFKITMTKAF